MTISTFDFELIMLDISKLKKLREETGVSFSLCKKALEEAKNNLEKAKKILFKQGAERVSQKLGAETSEGAIFTYIHHNKKIASIVELLCQTDFVSKNDTFHELGTEIAMQVASLKPKDTDELLTQEYIRDPSKTIDALVKEYILKLGENIKVNRILRWEIGEK